MRGALIDLYDLSTRSLGVSIEEHYILIFKPIYTGDIMPRREDLVRVIIESIEENRNSWVKALFYADKDVERIMGRLVEEWSRNNMRGEPLDYATLEELEILAEKAERYRDAPQEAFLRGMLEKSTGVGDKEQR